MCCASLDVAAGRCHAGTDHSGALGFPAWRALMVTVGSSTVGYAKSGMPPARAGGIGFFEHPSAPVSPTS
jgi:hypothetical protein